MFTVLLLLEVVTCDSLAKAELRYSDGNSPSSSLLLPVAWSLFTAALKKQKFEIYHY